MPDKLPIIKAKELIKILKKAGFNEWRQRGGHLTLYRDLDEKVVTIPVHFRKDIPKGTLRAIIRDAGFKNVHEFNELRRK